MACRFGVRAEMEREIRRAASDGESGKLNSSRRSEQRAYVSAGAGGITAPPRGNENAAPPSSTLCSGSGALAARRSQPSAFSFRSNFMLCASNRRVASLCRYIHILTYTLGPLPSLTWVGETEKVTRAEPGPLGLGLSSRVSQPPTCRTPPQGTYPPGITQTPGAPEAVHAAYSHISHHYTGHVA